MQVTSKSELTQRSAGHVQRALRQTVACLRGRVDSSSLFPSLIFRLFVKVVLRKKLCKLLKKKKPKVSPLALLLYSQSAESGERKCVPLTLGCGQRSPLGSYKIERAKSGIASRKRNRGRGGGDRLCRSDPKLPDAKKDACQRVQMVILMQPPRRSVCYWKRHSQTRSPRVRFLKTKEKREERINERRTAATEDERQTPTGEGGAKGGELRAERGAVARDSKPIL